MWQTRSLLPGCSLCVVASSPPVLKVEKHHLKDETYRLLAERDHSKEMAVESSFEGGGGEEVDCEAPKGS